MREFISKKILVYNPETGKHEPIDAIRGESAYEIAVRTGQTALPEDEWIKQVQNGQIDGDFVKTVNSLHPDETGNVEIEVGNPDVITTLTRDEFNALTTAQIQKMYEDGVRTILVENEMEEGEGTYTISWDGITDKPNAYPPTEHRHEYAENLLKNAEFKIATMGYNRTYNGTRYSANEWIGNGHGSLSVSNGVKTLVAEDGFTWMKQELWNDGRDIGKTYTLAITLPDGTHLVGSGTAPSAASNDEEVFIDLTAPDSRCWIMAMKVGNVMQVRIDASQIGASFSFLNVALYEGTYTAQNLPSFVPVDPRVEIMKLGIAPVNLLVNSDWRVKDNIINQHGETVFNNAGYWIDRWYAGITCALLDGQNHFEIVDGEGIKFTSPAKGYVDFYQNLENYSQLKGKPVTVAAKIIYKGEEKIAVNNFIAGEANGKVPLTADELVAVYSIDALNFLIRVFNAKNEQPSEVIICWIALYEGVHTAQTIPPFTPTHPRIEMLKLGLPVQPVNLLVNPDFAIAQAGYPVWDATNQKWTSGLHGTSLYVADRWIVEGLASASYSNQNGLTLKIVSESVGRLIQRSLSDNIYGKTITAAVYLSDGSMIVATGTHPASTPSAEEYFGQTTTTNMRLYLAALPAGVYDVHVWMRAGTTHTIKAIVCYEGSYTAETLPPYVPPDATLELAKCRRYYRKRHMETVMIAYSTMSAAIAVPREEMRIQNVTVTLKEAKMLVDYDFVDILYLSNMIATNRNGSLKFLFENGTDAPFVANRTYLAQIEFEEIADL